MSEVMLVVEAAACLRLALWMNVLEMIMLLFSYQRLRCSLCLSIVRCEMQPITLLALALWQTHDLLRELTHSLLRLKDLLIKSAARHIPGPTRPAVRQCHGRHGKSKLKMGHESALLRVCSLSVLASLRKPFARRKISSAQQRKPLV